MKTTFNFDLGSITMNIEGSPIELENVKLVIDNEYSVQELATSAGLIKDLVNQVRGIFGDIANNRTTAVAQTKVVKPKTPYQGELPKGTFTGGEPLPPVKVPLDVLWNAFENLAKNASNDACKVTTNGYGKWDLSVPVPTKKGEKQEYKVILSVILRTDRITIELDTDDINLDISIYDNRVYFSGMAPQYLEKVLTDKGIPSWVAEFINDSCSGRDIRG